MNTKSLHNYEFNNNAEECECEVPSPPPLPTIDYKSTKKLITVNKSQTLADEVKSLWKNREVITNGDVPSEFALTNLEAILQEGPNCGLAALAMAATATARRLTMDELFFQAKGLGFTKQGEMFSATNMAHLAKLVLNPWFTVELLTGGLSLNEDYILRSLLKDSLMLIPYDASGNYSPCCKRGHKSHWAVVCGIGKVTQSRGQPSVYLYARQGKSKHINLWSYQELEASNNNLVEFSPKRAEDGSEYILPAGGVQAGLAGKVVLLRMLHRGPDYTSIHHL